MAQAELKLAEVQEQVYEKNIMQDNENPNTDDETNARKGRPRSEKSRRAILKATNALLLRMSVQELSIEAIAKKAKVGKTTIYRWWPNKTAVVMDALVSQPGMQTPMPSVSNNADAIRMQLEKLIRLLDSTNGQTIAQLFSEAQASQESSDIFNNGFLEPLIDALEYNVAEGQKDGEFRKTLDPKMAVDMLCGPIFFRYMSHRGDFDGSFQIDYPAEAVRLISA